jgi:hypothetical protein
MGIQTKNITEVELLHGKVKNAVNKGFLEAFEVNEGSDRLNLTEQMRTQKLGLRKAKKNNAHGFKFVKAVKKEGLTEIEPFLTQIISINYRKEQS